MLLMYGYLTPDYLLIISICYIEYVISNIGIIDITSPSRRPKNPHVFDRYYVKYAFMIAKRVGIFLCDLFTVFNFILFVFKYKLRPAK